MVSDLIGDGDNFRCDYFLDFFIVSIDLLRLCLHGYIELSWSLSLLKDLKGEVKIVGELINNELD